MPERLSLAPANLTWPKNQRVTARLSSCTFAIACWVGSQQQAVAGMQHLPPPATSLLPTDSPQPNSPQAQTSSSSSCAALCASSAFPQERAWTKTLMRAKPNTKRSAPRWAGGGRFVPVGGRTSPSFQSPHSCLTISLALCDPQQES